ncbi:MAG: type II toxin-antitoxin system ParD family antitoxin [Flavobacteriales bacterium]|nr:type II toxin-antitoxin system ParD family antitoxin [Flavobacteriales bacterium]MBK6945629.1 type II toxin-antitoxin system ParD family antitoxin [Flavobacteriales bacterium]MBK7241738.1 type II toxin-antitoxin system ParD family antitoxin [Flavobacteriales bacterium]MBK7296264.1 type II toxin-antitoxin system ParD family antitoxin [Flavobacteriales bacterium]MBK9534818.1 type II toxin-antitoxin system ParD family antitoxin [Flavobacteriales bacterium]
MASTSLSLGSHWEKYIQTKIRSGRYGSVSEVVREALRAMEDHDKKLNALRGHLAQGESDAKNGKFVKDSSLKGLLGRSK